MNPDCFTGGQSDKSRFELQHEFHRIVVEEEWIFNFKNPYRPVIKNPF